jgi:hypothetical protein
VTTTLPGFGWSAHLRAAVAFAVGMAITSLVAASLDAYVFGPSEPKFRQAPAIWLALSLGASAVIVLVSTASFAGATLIPTPGRRSRMFLSTRLAVLAGIGVAIVITAATRVLPGNSEGRTLFWTVMVGLPLALGVVPGRGDRLKG